MPVISNSFDLQSVEWRRVTDPGNKDFKVDFEYSLLGYDLSSGRLDMLLRYARKGGHCRRHRHVAATATLVLEGEQFLEEMQADGTVRSVHRRKGGYALAPADALPHDEHGGEDGGTVLLSMTTENGVLFEYFDENMERVDSVSIEEFVTSWNEGSIYGKVTEANTPATS
jgi:hypothetical protein